MYSHKITLLQGLIFILTAFKYMQINAINDNNSYNNLKTLMLEFELIRN